MIRKLDVGDTANSDTDLLREAARALRDVGKAAIVVRPTLDKPYPDDPTTTPWARFMEAPARHAYNLGVSIARLLDEREHGA